MSTTGTRSRAQVVRRDAELHEALEQQAATAEILRVISAFPSDAAPVFDAIVRAARRLGRAQNAYAFQYDGRRIRAAASTDETPENKRALAELGTREPDRVSMCGRVIASRAPLATRLFHALERERQTLQERVAERSARSSGWRACAGSSRRAWPT